MIQFVSVNRSGKASDNGGSVLPVYPSIPELQFTLGIPRYDQFDTYLLVAKSEGMELMTIDEYFNRPDPPYDKVYALLCTSDAAHPDICRVVHYVLRIEGLSRPREIPEIGSLCTAYVSVLVQPGQAPEIGYVGWTQLANLRTPLTEGSWAQDLVFRPSYDRAYAAPDQPDSFAVQWTQDVDVIAYKTLAQGSEVPTPQIEMTAMFVPVNKIDASGTGIIADDSLVQGRIVASDPDKTSYMMQSILMSLVATIPSSTGSAEFYWSCLQRVGSTRQLAGRIIAANDPIHPKTIVEYNDPTGGQSMILVDGLLQVSFPAP